MNDWAGQVPCHPVEAAGAVYIEVPKAGCTSVKWALSSFKGGPPAEGVEIHSWFGYTHARGVDQLYEWLGTRWADLFRFTVVRDPIARFLSFYYGLAPHERGCYGDVSRYVLERFEADEVWRWNIHAIPQTLIIGRELERFDFVGRTEDMAGLEAELQRRVSPEIRVPHLNRSTQDRSTLTEEATERLREIFRTDLEVLGYAS